MINERGDAIWNTKYMPDEMGRCRKISEMSFKQCSKSIGICMARLKATKVQLDGLYQRREILMHEKGELDYVRKDTKQKIIKNLQLKKEIERDDRMQQILLTALNFIEQGQDINLVKAILEQARDEL